RAERGRVGGRKIPPDPPRYARIADASRRRSWRQERRPQAAYATLPFGEGWSQHRDTASQNHVSVLPGCAAWTLPGPLRPTRRVVVLAGDPREDAPRRGGLGVPENAALATDVA